MRHLLDKISTLGVFIAGAILVVALIFLLARTIQAAPTEQTFPGAGILGEVNLEFGWVLYIRELNNSEERTLIVTRSQGGSPSAQCKFNSSNTREPELSGPMTLPNSDVVYDLFIERSAEQAVLDFLGSFEGQSFGELLSSAQDLDLSDLGIGDIHGSITIPATDTLAIPPSVVC